MDMFVDRSYFEEVVGRERIRQVLAPYHSWVAALPLPLRDNCRALIGDEIVNSNLVNLPFLLAEPFGISDACPIEKLVVGNAFMLTYFLASDKLFDEPSQCDRFLILLAAELLTEMVRQYEQVAPGRVGEIWAGVMQNHVAGLIEEETHHDRCRHHEAGLSLEAYERAILLKNRYGTASIPLLAAVAPYPQAATVLEQVCGRMTLEIEFDDDLKDWVQDLAAGRFTPAVLALAGAAQSRDEARLRGALVTSTAVSAILDRIDLHLSTALDLLTASGLSYEMLRGWIARHREANLALRADIIRRQVRYALQQMSQNPDSTEPSHRIAA